MNFKLLLAFPLLFHTGSGFAQNGLRLTDTLPNDPQVKIGKLPNGLTYYIQRVDTGSKMMRLDFLVKAGYMQEDADQLENAHLLEHIAMKGSAAYPNGIFPFTERLGVPKGNGVNASTGYDVTSYFMELPASHENLKTGLALMRGVAGDLLIKPEDVDIEAKAVIGETIRSAGVEQRILNFVVPKVLGSSMYATRGVSEDRVLDPAKFNRESLVRFYKDWYRPELEAILVTGDIPPDSTEAWITSTFSDLSSPAGARPHIIHPLFVPGRNQLITFTDKEQHALVVMIYHKHPGIGFNTVQDLKKGLVLRLYNIMAERYVSTLMKKYNSPVQLVVHTYDEKGVISMDGMSQLRTYIRINAIEDMQPALVAVMSMVNSFRRSGFTQEDLAYARARLQADLKPAKSTPVNRKTRLTDHFVYQQAIPAAETQLAMEKQILGEIVLADVNAFAQEAITEKNRDIVLLAPDQVKDKLPALATLESWIASARPEPLPKHASAAQLIPVEGKNKGSVRERHELAAIETTELLLNNGVKLLVKAMPGSKGRVQIRAFKAVGARTIEGIGYRPVRLATDAVLNSGVANLDKFQLKELIDSRSIYLDPYTGDYAAGFKGSVPHEKGLEGISVLTTLMQQYMMAPGKRSDAFPDWVATQKRYNKEIEPLQMVRDSIRHFTGEERVNLPVDDITMQDVYKAYQAMYGNAAGLTVTVAGDFDKEKVIPVLVKYFGALPAGGKAVPFVKPPAGKASPGLKQVIRASVEYPEVIVRFAGNMEADMYNTVHASILSRILHERMTERLREQEKGIYAVLTGGHPISSPAGRYIFQVDFRTTRENLDRHLAAVRDELSKLRTGLVAGEQLALYKSDQQEAQKAEMKRPAFWSQYFSEYVANGRNPEDILGYDKILQQVTAESIRAFVVEYLPEEGCMEFVVIPE